MTIERTYWDGHPVFKVEASYAHFAGPGQPQSVTIRAIVGPPAPKGLSWAEARAIGQAWLDEQGLPKSLGFKPGTLMVGPASGSPEDVWGDYPFVTTHASLWSNKANGGRNETGIARYHRVMARLDKAGLDVRWTSPFGNAYETREAFEAALKED